MSLYYIVKDCEWCGTEFHQRSSNTIGRRTCSTTCMYAMRKNTIQRNSLREISYKGHYFGKLTMSLQPILDDFKQLRADNADVFFTPDWSMTFNYIHEETSELCRVAQRMYNPEHLRGNALDMELDYKKHVEWGDLLMMVMTAAQQMEIDPDKAKELVLAKINARCAAKRAELKTE